MELEARATDESCRVASRLLRHNPPCQELIPGAYRMDTLRELHQRMLEVDDLIKSGTE